MECVDTAARVACNQGLYPCGLIPEPLAENSCCSRYQCFESCPRVIAWLAGTVVAAGRFVRSGDHQTICVRHADLRFEEDTR